MWISNQFLSRVSTLAHDIDITIRSVRPSVRHVPILYRSDLYCHSFFIARQPNHSSFMSIKHVREILTESPPCGSARYRWGIKISRFSTSLYLANDWSGWWK